MSEDLNKTLEERGATYGDFGGHALMAERAMAEFDLPNDDSDPRLRGMAPDQVAAAVHGTRMILHKLARLWNGTPGHLDTWHDIAGYATITKRVLERKE